MIEIVGNAVAWVFVGLIVRILVGLAWDVDPGDDA